MELAFPATRSWLCFLWNEVLSFHTRDKLKDKMYSVINICVFVVHDHICVKCHPRSLCLYRWEVPIEHCIFSLQLKNSYHMIVCWSCCVREMAHKHILWKNTLLQLMVSFFTAIFTQHLFQCFRRKVVKDFTVILLAISNLNEGNDCRYMFLRLIFHVLFIVSLLVFSFNLPLWSHHSDYFTRVQSPGRRCLCLWCLLVEAPCDKSHDFSQWSHLLQQHMTKCLCCLYLQGVLCN